MARLVLIANTRLPSPRAQGLQVLHAAAAFARAGEAVRVLHAQRRDTALWEREDLLRHYGLDPELALEVQALPCADWIDRVPRRWQYLPARWQEWTFARRAAQHVKRWCQPAGEPTRVLCREIETAHALRSREDLFLEIHRVPGGNLRRRWLREAAQACQGVLAISGGVREDLLELGVPADKVFVEHDAFDAGRFRDLPERAEARRVLGLPAEGPVVVYTGGLLAWKGVDVLIEASRTLTDVRFVIAGGMEADVQAMRALARGLDHVQIVGFQPPDRVPLYLAAADVGVVPNRSTPAISARYTSPLKVFEAMAVGLPLVVSDLPSMRDILGPEEAVFVKPDDGNALAEALKSLLRDDARRKKLGQTLGLRAQEHTFDARAARILKWMQGASGPT